MTKLSYPTLVLLAAISFLWLGCHREKKNNFFNRHSEFAKPIIPDFLKKDSIQRNELIGIWTYIKSTCVNQYNYLPALSCRGNVNMENTERIIQIDSAFFRLYAFPLERYYERSFDLQTNQLKFSIDSLAVDVQHEQYLKRSTMPVYKEPYVYVYLDALFLIQFEFGQISYDKYQRRNIEKDSLVHLDKTCFDWSSLQTKWHFSSLIKPPVAMECDSSKFLPDTLDLRPENESNFKFQKQQVQVINKNDTITFEFFALRGNTLYINYLCDGEFYLINYSRN